MEWPALGGLTIVADTYKQPLAWKEAEPGLAAHYGRLRQDRIGGRGCTATSRSSM